jgi:2-alkyl-3-oxoalkanoate reductase
MKIFIAGATGAMGRPLTSMLVQRGHAVFGTTRTPGKRDQLSALGATPVLLDILDRQAVVRALEDSRPDVVVHQATALSGFNDFRKYEESFVPTNRLRTEGIDNLLEGMRRAGIRRIVAQSYAGPGAFARSGALVKTEDDTLDPHPLDAMRATVEAMAHLERVVLGTGGIDGTALRYGGFYGPGTGLGEGGDQLEGVRRRRFPIVGNGSGVWSFMHIDDGAAATVLAIESWKTGTFNIVDDEPAPVAEWLPVLAGAVGAKAPRRVPAWLGRLFAGELGVVMMNESRGASNAKAKSELGWKLMYPTWRLGFSTGLSEHREMAA